MRSLTSLLALAHLTAKTIRCPEHHRGDRTDPPVPRLLSGRTGCPRRSGRTTRAGTPPTTVLGVYLVAKLRYGKHSQGLIAPKRLPRLPDSLLLVSMGCRRARSLCWSETVTLGPLLRQALSWCPTNGPCPNAQDENDHLDAGRSSRRPGLRLELSRRRPGASAAGLGQPPLSVPNSQRPRPRKRSPRPLTRASRQMEHTLP